MKLQYRRCFQRGCPGRTPNGGSRANAAHVTKSVQPGDCNSWRRGWRPTSYARRSRHRL